MRATRLAGLGLALCLIGQSAAAQVPGPRRPVFAPRFSSWAPLGSYERAAFREEGALRIMVPTRHRNVEIAFVPQSVLSDGYGAEHVDGAGLRRGIRAPRFTAWTGRIERNSGRDFAKLSYQAELGKLVGLLRVDGAFYELEADLADGAYLMDVSEVDANEVGELMRSCGVQADEAALAASSTSTPTALSGGGGASAAAVALREIELGTEVDSRFVAQTGGVSAANARVLAIVNLVNGIYETDLGLTNRVVVQRSYASSDPYTSNDSDTLLDQFTSLFPRNAATPHDDALLFTGRDLDGSTVGVAWLEATCTPYRYGVAQLLSQSDSLTGLIAAHELGHNLGARHSGEGLMAPTINPAYDYFSQASKDEIAFYTGPLACLATVAASSGNAAPVLDPVGPQLATEGQPVVIQLAATDADGDTVDYGATPLPVGATLSPSGRFEWTPPRDAAGCSATREYSVRFSATDGLATATELVPISVADLPSGAAPVLQDPQDRSVYAGRLIQFQLQASDADGDTIAFSAAGLPKGASLSRSGVFRWTPKKKQVGAFAITFAVADCTGLSSTESVQIDVTPRPAPHLLSISPATGSAGATVTLTGTELAGKGVKVRVAGRKARVLSVANDAVTVLVPDVTAAVRDAGPQPVTLTRDGARSDNALAFDYETPPPAP